MFEIDHKYCMDTNGVIWIFCTSQYMPNDPPSWYRTYNSVMPEIAQEFFRMKEKYEPDTISQF